MLEIIFGILVAFVFVKLGLFAIKMAWGFTKICLFLIFLPLIIVFTFIKGLVMISWPLLIIAGIVVLLTTK